MSMECGSRVLSDLSEDILVRLAQQRDQEAFQELVIRAQDTCMRLATCILRNREDAADEVQNAVCKAFTHIEAFGHNAKFSTWIARIVINHCHMRFRRANRVRFVSYETNAGDGARREAYEPVNVQTPELFFGRTEVIQLLRCEVGRIPRKLRSPLELHYFEGVPLAQVANRLGLTVAATKSRLHRAQSFLRDRMLRHCGSRGVGTLTR
jgi:RNA polymerase sigma-70 factor, ECF subfamily